MTKNINNTGVEWDLSDFYKGIDDPKLAKDKKEIESLSKNLSKNYKSKINTPNLTAKFFLSSLIDYENIIEKLNIFENYAYYLFSKNTQSDTTKKFFQNSQEFGTKIQSQLLWYELEWQQVSENKARQLLNNPILSVYKHFLKHIRTFKPFILSEKEEKVFTLKSQTSNLAFIRLFDQTEAGSKFKLKINNKTQELSSSELSSIMKTNPDRNIRKKAVIAYSEGNSKNGSLYTYILNTLLLDKKISDEIREYKYPQEATFLRYEVDKEIVKNMSDVISNSSSIAEKFYLAKRKLLKYNKLYEWDRYSQIYFSNNRSYSWDEAKEIILKSFSDFSPVFSDTTELFFKNNWIDSKITPGKRSGAYCSYGTPSTHPNILTNYSGKIEDISTLAHELGHGIHTYLARDQKMLEFYPSTAVAEIASIFAESLVFEKLFETAKNKKEKINLLGNRIQDRFATVLRQNAFYIFENKIHKLRREKGELPQEEISNIYQQTLQETFGKGLTLTNYHKNFWMPITHFYHYNFYVFTYALGELLATSLFSLYKEQGKVFVNKYIKALSKGGSLSPIELTKIMGVDISQKDFWQKGISLLDKEVDKFVKLTS